MQFWKGSNLFKEIQEKLSSTHSVSINGLTDAALITLISDLYNSRSSDFLVVVEKEKDIYKIVEYFKTFLKEDPVGFPEDYPVQQIDCIKRFSGGERALVVVSPDGLSDRIISPDLLKSISQEVKIKETVYKEILECLQNAGYIRTEIVSEPGEFARRGEVIDFWSPQEDNPIRLHFKIDSVDVIKSFDPLTQRTIQQFDSVQLLPAQFPEDSKTTLMDYVKEGSVICLFDDIEMDLQIADYQVLKRVKFNKADLEISSSGFSYSRNFSDIKKKLSLLKDDNYLIKLTAPYKQELDKLNDMMAEELKMEFSGFISNIDKGFIVDDIKTILISIGDVLPSYRSGIVKKPISVHPITEFSDLKPGDFIIHRKFGIGQFEGIQKIEHGFVESDFLKLKYSKESKLYVAVENADFIQKYVGGGSKTRLDSISSKSWNKTAKSVRASVKHLAKRLVEIYKERANRGISMPGNPDLEQEFADNFPYQLTPHQKQASKEVLADMESANAMDRLVCGDVGYGKTEIAMRAAFRAAISGYQVVLLAPTTVLARQHFHTFRQRFSVSPVVIEMLSRLVQKDEQKSIINRVNEGKVDILVGTHRVLSKELNLPALGLIIIDEEQRFGVEQKEKLRFKYKSVDLLTTTATPIPRTLSMAFGRLKGLSLINTPPPGRVGIKTQTMPFDFDTVKEAILHEVNRGGQCFYVHSRVATIPAVTKILKKSMPDLSFGFIHGRMAPEVIEGIMADFVEGEIDCLIATTIIENGLDIPNVNTIIIDSSERLGLADIYQLRGRVGRSSIKAYCYLMYPPGLDLTGDMRERLSALSTFSTMGSGFQLALRDLEIRGAGELLGPGQHGNIMKVGFDYYSRILNEEIAKLRGDDYVEPIDVEISLPISAYIPEKYIDSSSLRLAFYRRLSSLRDENELNEIVKEISDRFGIVPKELKNLLQVIKIKILASNAGIKEVKFVDNQLSFILMTGEKMTERAIESSFMPVILKRIKEIKSLKN